MARRNPILWPPGMILTFTSAMNLLKQMKKEGIKDPKITRHDVYTHLRRHKEKFKEVFEEKEPYENMIYNYMDEFIKEGYFTVVDEFKVMIKGNKEKKYQNLTSTLKAERLYEWLWIATNLTSKEAIGNIVREAIKDDRELSKEKKESIVKQVENKCEEKRLSGFPFSISKELAKKLLKEGRL